MVMFLYYMINLKGGALVIIEYIISIKSIKSIGLRTCQLVAGSTVPSWKLEISPSRTRSERQRPTLVHKRMVGMLRKYIYMILEMYVSFFKLNFIPFHK